MIKSKITELMPHEDRTVFFSLAHTFYNLHGVFKSLEPDEMTVALFLLSEREQHEVTKKYNLHFSHSWANREVHDKKKFLEVRYYVELACHAYTEEVNALKKKTLAIWRNHSGRC